MHKKLIYSISIDLGAKNTGVYFASYEERSRVDNIKSEGKVYQLDPNSYTLLLENRTAKRHQRRCFDRRQLVKRLFRVIWQKHFALMWNDETQQAISFLLNRRGFTFEPENENERHRRCYFEEIKKILTTTNYPHRYLKHFCQKLHTGKFKGLDEKKLANLIGHLNNLELKPLRWYFNDKRHSQGDYWDKNRLQEIFIHWVINTWRIDKQKDNQHDNQKEKKTNGEYNYRKLKNNLQHQEDIIEFFLTTDPKRAIPPYQDNNNRHPPRCQSLLLNRKFLDDHYPQWQMWLRDLKKLCPDPVKDFIDSLQSLMSSGDKPYFVESNSVYCQSISDLDARILQFIFDQAKDSDPFKLNEIFAYTKKLRQLQSSSQEKEQAREDIERTIESSKLSKNLKTARNYENEVFAEGSFLHLVCRYYKYRQKARAGRIFIHDTNDVFLTYCDRKPRHKKHQLLDDLASLLRVSRTRLRKVIGSNDNSTDEARVTAWLKNFTGLKSNAEKSCDEQKKYRGNIKTKIEGVYFKDQKNASLYKVCERSKKLVHAINCQLDKPKDTTLDNNPAKAIYTLSQVHNLIFKDRSGNANTCAVCSADNAQRMQEISGRAKAQRLPAINTRLIDGAVKRIAHIVGGAIADEGWKHIEQKLSQGQAVRVPIITESNRFEFEENLGVLKKKAKKYGKQPDFFVEKEKRIRRASQGVCPYTGADLDGGEIDHIIPRSSETGTLNDEANLIHASKEGNRQKSNKKYFLSDLHAHYKRKQFDSTDDNEITRWIEEQLGGDKKYEFKFGRYSNFLNLTLDQQKAFRHALYLPTNHKLRKLVIKTIDHRKQSFVNGTQRYFAEVIARNFYQKAKKLGKARQISFDYFAVEARSSTRGDGVSDYRRQLEKDDAILQKYSKDPSKKQNPYSHLIDAQIAFAIVANNHKRDGGLKLDIADHLDPEDIYKKIRLTDSNIYCDKLKRKKPTETFCSHRAFTRDTLYADHYLPILLKKETDIVCRAGFTWKNSFKFESKDNQNLQKLLPLCAHLPSGIEIAALYDKLAILPKFKEQLHRHGYYYLCVDKQKLHDFWLRGRDDTGAFSDKEFFGFCWSTIGYRTENKPIARPKDLVDILQKDAKFKVGKNECVELPVKKEWQRCLTAWQNSGKDDKEFLCFLQEYFKAAPNHKHAHQKTRNVYSLPVKTGEGKLLLRRRNWNGKHTDQIINDSDSRSVDNKPCLPVRTSEYKKAERLAWWAQTKNTVKLSTDTYHNGEHINSERWYPIECQDFPTGVKGIEYRVDDCTRPSIRLVLERSKAIVADGILKHPLCKAKEKSKAKSLIEGSTGTDVEYKASGYNREITSALQESLRKHHS